MPPLPPLQSRVLDSIAARRQAMLDDLRLHVGIPTGLNNSSALAETRQRFCERLVNLGASVELIQGDPKPAWLEGATDSNLRIPPTAVCRRKKTGALAHVLIAGHLDTVHDPAGSFRELSISPDGKTATGPGCVDMKGGLVIALAALEALEECGVPVSWSFVLNSDEETGSYHSNRALRSIAKEHTVGLALEPAMANGALATARGGSGQFMIDCRGKSAHVGRDFASGISAVDALCRTVVAAHGLSDTTRGVCVNVGPLQGGTATNVVPDHARAWGNVRFPLPAAAETLGASLDALARGSATDLPHVTLERSFHRPAKPASPASDKLAALAREVAEELGQSLPFGTTAGVCDGNNLQDAGLPTIDTLGVRGGGLHTPQEWIELASLVERAQLLAGVMMRVCGRGI